MGHYMSSMAKAQAEQLADVEEAEAITEGTTELEKALSAEFAEAALDAVLLADIQQPQVTLPNVDVGTRVVYIPRPGHSRMGRNAFPADVLHINPDDGSVELFVVMEAEDLVTESRVGMMRDADDRHCWRHVRTDESAMHEPSRLNSQASRLVEVEDQLVVLKDQVFGEYVSPPKAVMDYLADFDARLRAMEEALASPKAAPKSGKARKT